VLAVAVLLAALVHACALVVVRWQPERTPIRETLVRIVHVAVGRDAVVAEQPPRTAPTPPTPVPRPLLDRMPRPSPRPRAIEAPAPAPAEAVAPATSVPQSESVASAPAPIARETISAQPRYRTNPEPPYPVVARRRRQQGVVLLSVRVDVAGRPETVAIQSSSGFAALDEAAVAAVKNWEFEPGRLAGEPVPSQVEVPIRFELDRD